MNVLVSTLCLLCALVGAQAAPDAASLARIKAALQRPAPKLVINPPRADFRVNIEAIRPSTPPE